MPQIIVTAGDAAGLKDGNVTLRERINASDFESGRFGENLLERLGWAVSDAAEVEQRGSDALVEADEPEDAPEGAKVAEKPRELVEA